MTELQKDAALSGIRALMRYVGEDPSREGLQDTPGRVLAAWSFWTQGYGMNAKEILKTFDDGADGCDEMVVRKNVPLYSKCEHHLADIIGRVTVAYIPKGKIVGLSKLDRLVVMYGRRLQVQERLTNQIADALNEHLAPIGVGVWVSARHMCVESRGVQHGDSTTITSALRGAMRTDASARAEFFALVNS